MNSTPTPASTKIKDFTDLVVWQKAHDLVLDIYKITKSFPEDEKFGIISQMRRCSTSITANLAEGFGRQGSKEKVQFYTISRGSSVELQDHLLISRDLNYASEGECDELAQKAVVVNKLINGLIRSIHEI